MNSVACLKYVQQMRRELGPVTRPNISLTELFELERRSHGLFLARLAPGDGNPENSPLTPAGNWLLAERLAFCEQLIATLATSYSPSRVRNWRKHFYWLFVLSWELVGVKQWRERETLRAAILEHSSN